MSRSLLLYHFFFLYIKSLAKNNKSKVNIALPLPAFCILVGFHLN